MVELIFPADAGVNLYTESWLDADYYIPRGCGGEPMAGLGCGCCGKYSPRMRG